MGSYNSECCGHFTSFRCNYLLKLFKVTKFLRKSLYFKDLEECKRAEIKRILKVQALSSLDLCVGGQTILLQEFGLSIVIGWIVAYLESDNSNRNTV